MNDVSKETAMLQCGGEERDGVTLSCSVQFLFSLLDIQENRLIFGKVKAYKNGVPIFAPSCTFVLYNSASKSVFSAFLV